MFKKLIFCSFIVIFSLFSFSVFADDSEVIIEVEAEDLEVAEAGVFSWLQGIVRDAQILITRDPIKKSELQLKKASAQLIRARKMVKNNPDDVNLTYKLEKIDVKYEGLIQKVNERVEKFQAENPDAPKLKNFLDKYTEQQLKHQEILRNMELRVPEKAMEIINANRMRHLEKFGETMNRLQTKEELKERLGEMLENQGEETENKVRRMETIDELEKVPVIRAQVQEIKQEHYRVLQELKIEQQKIENNNLKNNSGSGTVNGIEAGETELTNEETGVKNTIKTRFQNIGDDLKNKIRVITGSNSD
ncbi:MAG: hypothetical protein ABIC36_01325 [bacterium]